MGFRQPPLAPRNGHTLVVGVIARISGGPNQKELSLDDQVDHAKQEIAELYTGEVENRVIATTGKGERLDRPELAVVERMLRSRELDLLVCEDIGRLVRGAEAARLCGVAVDHGVRVIAPNDCVDTADPSWEADVLDACKEHVGHNAHTSKRLKHKLMNRFRKFGGAVARPIYGYVVPDGAKTYDDWRKDDAAVPIYKEWFRRLREDPNCSAVADWLNAAGVPTGKYARRKRWDGKMVRRVTRNPLLKGCPTRGVRRTVKHHERGRWVSVRSPDQPVQYHAPHLAHIDPLEWDEVNTLLESANRNLGRKPVNGSDPLLRVPRTRSRFPGCHARCWYCGRHYVWGGNGQAGRLMCAGARGWQCWNAVAFDGELAVSRLTQALTAELYRLDGFDDQFRRMVERAAAEGGEELARRRNDLRRREVVHTTERENLLAAVAAYGPRPMLAQKLTDLEVAERALARERGELGRRAERRPRLPSSVGEVRRLLEDQLRGLAADSSEFATMLRLVVPEFHVHLVRLADGGHLLPRAVATVCLAGAFPDAADVPGVGPLLTRTVVLDLFDPPQRERIREQSARLAAERQNQRQIAAGLSEPATQTAVYRALALDRQVRVRGLSSPYTVVLAPPGDNLKLRRHKNRKYRFEPAAGYQPPPL